MIPAAIKSGAKGLVIGGTLASPRLPQPSRPPRAELIPSPLFSHTGTGAGSTTDLAQPYITSALASGIPIVISSKTNGGAVPPKGKGAISSGFLNPVKSRLQLALAIASGMEMEEIRGLFEDKLSGFLEA